MICEFIESNLSSSLPIFPCSLSVFVSVWEVWGVDSEGMSIPISARRGFCVLKMGLGFKG